MPIHNRPSADGQAILLLCSSVGLGKDAGVKALTPTEYNDVVPALRACGHTPAGLLGLGPVEIQERLGTKPEQSDRIARLLGRGVQFAIEMEQLGSMGIWAVSRAEAAYPQRWKDRLKSSAPPVVFGVGDLARLGEGGLAVVGSRDVDDAGAAFARAIAHSWSGVRSRSIRWTRSCRRR